MSSTLELIDDWSRPYKLEIIMTLLFFNRCMDTHGPLFMVWSMDHV
jgi:hypothetical protein